MELKKAIEEFKRLHAELLEIKKQKSFKEFGFGRGGPYYKWMDEVRGLQMSTVDVALFDGVGLTISDLRSLGMAYVYSEGRETDFTKSRNKLIQRKIYTK